MEPLDEIETVLRQGGLDVKDFGHSKNVCVMSS